MDKLRYRFSSINWAPMLQKLCSYDIHGHNSDSLILLYIIRVGVCLFVCPSQTPLHVQFLARATFLRFLVVFSCFWNFLTVFSCFWSFLAVFSYFLSFWQFLSVFGVFLQYLAVFDFFLQFLAVFEFMTVFGGFVGFSVFGSFITVFGSFGGFCGFWQVLEGLKFSEAVGRGFILVILKCNKALKYI